MRQTLSVAALAFSIVMFAAIPARSQGATFVDGSATADVFKGTFAGGGGVGVVLSPRYDLRFEFEAARWEFASSHGRSEIGNFDMLQGTRPVSYSILLGRRFQPKRRAQLAMVAGLGVLRHSWIDSGHQDFRFNGVVTKEFSWDDHGTTNDPHLTFGLEAVVSVSAHFAVIPRWRVQLSSASAEGSSGGYYLPTTTLRNVAGIAGRWRF
jgi:hypothetical protein